MKKKTSKTEWKATQTSNLVRRNESTYYAQLKIGGKTYRRSLRTDKLPVARAKLSKELNSIRAAAEDVLEFNATGSSRQTLRECLEEWLTKEDARPDLKESTKVYNARRKDDLLKTLPVDEPCNKVKVSHLREWWSTIAGKFNAQYANNLLSVVKIVIDYQVEAGLRIKNEAKDFKRMKLTKVIRDLPSGEEMTAIIDCIQSSESSDMVAFMAYAGLRPSEMLNLKGEDLRDDVLIVRLGDKKTKNYRERIVPIMKSLEEVANRRRETKGPLWSIKSPQGAIKTASRKTGIKITQYDCRHFFATRCLESGVDVPTVAKWLGHQDGGALLMRTYSHVTDAHGLEVAKKVNLG